jgi:hypothetical protein
MDIQKESLGLARRWEAGSAVGMRKQNVRNQIRRISLIYEVSRSPPSWRVLDSPEEFKPVVAHRVRMRAVGEGKQEKDTQACHLSGL